MAQDFTKVSINQIDMDAVTEAVIAKGNLVYRDDHSDKKADDVDKVGGVAANRVAKSIENDRDTVENSLKLGGVPASDYMTVTKGNSLTKRTDNIKSKFGKDILSLRDELYQLRGQLAKNGYVKDIGYYDGFYDCFHDYSQVHLNKELVNTKGVVQGDKNTLTFPSSTDMEQFSQYDFIAIINSGTGLQCIRQVASVDNANNKIVLDRNIANSVIVQNAEYYVIKKSYGSIFNGDFLFARPLETVMGDEEYASGETDDTHREYIKMMKPGFGYATTLKFSEGKTGFLKTVELCLKAYGNPGPINCYLIQADDVDLFKNGQHAEALYAASKLANDNKFKFFAKTQPKAISPTVDRQYVKFSFKQDGKYPILPENYYQNPTRYCLIVEFLEVNTENYYELELINHENNDLQSNNIFYDYERQSDTSVKHALTQSDETKKKDLYFQFVTQQKLTNQPSPVNEGLYSAHIYNRRLQQASKARVELRIKREGIYETSLATSPSIITTESISLKRNPKNATINSVHELSLKSEINKPMELRRGDISDISMPVDVVIGENVIKIKGFNTESVTTQTPVLVNDNDPIYRVGYVVALKAREYKFKDGALTKGQFKRFILPLTEVVKDVHTYMDGVSDRLIFEAPLYEANQRVVDYNDFEVQVYWENPELSDSSVTKQEQMGALKEITVSFASDFE
nr:MAG TPA: hypothetical protein [Caudoviricetes sp.]